MTPACQLVVVPTLILHIQTYSAYTLVCLVWNCQTSLKWVWIPGGETVGVHLHVVSGGMEAHNWEGRGLLRTCQRNEHWDMLAINRWRQNGILPLHTKSDVEWMTRAVGIKLEYLFYSSLKIAQKNVPYQITKCLPAPQWHEALSRHSLNKRPSSTARVFDWRNKYRITGDYRCFDGSWFWCFILVPD